MTEARHPIQLAARLTGLSTYVIRIWEQRYKAVEPHRTPANHRLYAQSDIERLSLLREVTQAGHNIGQVAHLTNDELRTLMTEEAGSNHPSRPGFQSAKAAQAFLEAGLVAVEALDGQGLDDTLKRACTALGSQGVLHHLVAPLIQTLGDLWREGKITAAHEHFATGHLRGFLSNLSKPFGNSPAAPGLVVATPVGQMHEMGALLAGAAAANLGWKVTYLGSSLPAAEIAGAGRQRQARAVALSIVYPEDDPSLPGELTLLRELLPAEVSLIVGGRALPAYREVLERVGAILVEDLVQLGLALDQLRQPARKGKR